MIDCTKVQIWDWLLNYEPMVTNWGSDYSWKEQFYHSYKPGKYMMHATRAKGINRQEGTRLNKICIVYH